MNMEMASSLARLGLVVLAMTMLGTLGLTVVTVGRVEVVYS